MAEPALRRTASLAVLAAILGLLTVTVLALSGGGGGPAPDRAQELSLRLRCPVCKSVSIAESPSDTATAMRQAVSEQVAAGRTDAQIVDYFRARYGSWVLLDPPTRGATLLLWLAPLGVAVAGAALVATRARRAHDPPAAELDEPDRARLDAAVSRARATVLAERDEP